MSQARALLDLHLAQAELALNKVANNNYSDKRKQDYHNILFQLFNQIKESVSNKAPQESSLIYTSYKRHLDVIFKSLEFLENSTLNQIPYEIVYCIELALNDWTKESELYIVVTSLVNNISKFSFDHTLIDNESVYKDIEKNYPAIHFTHRLVQINVPSVFSRDYLALVVLYHELGHFIDSFNRVSESVRQEICRKINEKKFPKEELNHILIFFPFISEIVNHPDPLLTYDSKEFKALKFHIAEYFCDLFASQYIGESINAYLGYVTEDKNDFENTHPSTTNRVKVVQDFLNSTENIVVSIIKEAVVSITEKELMIRFSAVNHEPIFNLVPLTIKNEKELHGLFISAWNIWLSESQKLNSAIGNATNSNLKSYKVLNNLIEKTIGNYITKNRWEKGNQV